MVLIGLTGPNGAGKGVLAEFLKARSFLYLSLSDEIRAELESRNVPVTRDNLVRVGTELRERHGPAVLADRVLAKLSPDRNYVIDSIRHPAEVDALRGHGGFTLLQVEASPEVRFERLKARGRESDPKAWKAFLKLDAREAGSAGASAQQVEAVARLANHIIVNEGTIGEFQAAAAALVSKLIGNFKRPGWDEYFMGIAKVVASRSNCVKRKVAAIIVKDKRIISTGYNGTPRGTKNCNEGGCPRCQALDVTGARLEECLCSHAEENALTQAAYHGTPVKGAVLYTTYSSCLLCTKMIINAGISELVYGAAYSIQDTAVHLLQEAGVKVRQLGAGDP
jgi:dCMP deaminase